MDLDTIKNLLQRYLEGSCSEEEREQVESWYIQEVEKSNNPKVNINELKSSKSKIWENVVREKSPKAYRFKTYLKLSIAASFLIICGIALSIYKKPGANVDPKAALTQTIVPGGNKAILTLADGSKIDLEDAKNGIIASEQQSVIKKEDGLLVYEIENGAKIAGAAELLNTIDIPKGGQYQLVLPDGTKVWLNSMSSLKYPSSFSGSERRIVLNGEAYFEVAKNKAMPFIVQTSEMEVEVLGTHFNVMAYENEANQEATLLEGAVKIKQKKSNLHKRLTPGYKAGISPDENGISIEKTDTESVVAWKNGIFQFDKENIKTIMKKLERWYDIDVVYEGNIPDDQYVGKISKNTNLNEVLKVLSLSKIKYQLKGKTIIIRG